jgi:hypothetical protein
MVICGICPPSLSKGLVLNRLFRAMLFQLFEELVYGATGEQGMALLRVIAPADFKLLQETNQARRAKLAAQRFQSS